MLLVLGVRPCAWLGAGDLRTRGLSTYVTQAELLHIADVTSAHAPEALLCGR